MRHLLTTRPRSLANLLVFAALAGGTAWSPRARAETARQRLDLARVSIVPWVHTRERLSSHGARYRYQISCFRRLLTREKPIRACVRSHRRVRGEFHDRLDFTIAPDGKLTRFSVMKERRLERCLRPHLSAVAFPPFDGNRPYVLHLLVGSPDARANRRRRGRRPEEIFPVGTGEEKRRYSQAVFWFLSPWSMAISRCAEWVDRAMGAGYKTTMKIAIDPAGRLVQADVRVTGKKAGVAIGRIATCVAPFLKGMRAPRHAGPDNFVFRHGTTTTAWGRR